MALFLVLDLFSVDPGSNLDDLSLEIDRLTAIVGSEVTFENNAELDVSTLDSTGEKSSCCICCC